MKALCNLKLSVGTVRWPRKSSASVQVQNVIRSHPVVTQAVWPIGGVEVWLYSFMTNDTRRGRGDSVTPRPLFTPGKDPVPIVQEAGWAPGPVRIGAENLASTGIRFPDRPARSQSLYRLSYPVH